MVGDTYDPYHSRSSLKHRHGHSLVLHCQFQLESKTGTASNPDDKQELWFLLTRHIVDMRRTTEFISLHVSEAEGRASEYERIKNASRTDPKVNTLPILLE